MNSISPGKTPFITVGQDEADTDCGPSSPFHAMGEEEGKFNMVKASPSDFSMPDQTKAEDGILMVQMSNSSVHQDDDDNSTHSTLKVFQGTADFDYDMTKVQQSSWEFGKTRRSIVTILYMSIFAIVGSLFRMVLAQLFGEECKNPGTIGWLKAGQPLCVTADGDTSISGGIIFADFPANLLGSFIMGLMQSTDTMDLPKTLSIAWLHEDHIFQSFDIIHLAIKTGFCGSLTTFSSWNSEMVMMFLGEDSDRGSLIFRALFGYFIGVETCVASFILGKNIARYIFARVNPALQLEAAEIERRKQCGVYINTELADYERRFLSGFKMGEHSIYISAEAEEQLNKWKVSTEQCRRNGHNLLPLLTDVEYQAMALGEPLTRELIVPSVEAGWDIEALENWVYMKRKLNLRGGGGPPGHDFKFTPAFTLFSILFCAMFFGLILMDSNDSYSVTNRTMLFAGLLAPLGALLRWKLSDLNGSIQRYNWFPLGTFYANVSASLLSAAMIGLESHFYGHNSFWGLGTVRAIKVGFTGCLSTVSTFVTEVAGFIKSPNPMYGYMYVFVSIFTAALCGAIAFSVIELAEEEYYY